MLYHISAPLQSRMEIWPQYFPWGPVSHTWNVICQDHSMPRIICQGLIVPWQRLGLETFEPSGGIFTHRGKAGPWIWIVEKHFGMIQVQVKVMPKSCLQLYPNVNASQKVTPKSFLLVSPNVNASQKVTPKSFLLVSPNAYAAPLESWNGKTYQLSCSSARQGIFQELKV